MKRLLLKGLWGTVLGFVVARIGFADFSEVHNMFLLADFRMFLSFAFGTALILMYFLFVNGFQVEQQSQLTPGTVPGSVLFGAGWALTGGCPAVIMLQLSHGYTGAFLTLAGVSIGMIAYRQVHQRFFTWNTATCEA